MKKGNFERAKAIEESIAFYEGLQKIIAASAEITIHDNWKSLKWETKPQTQKTREPEYLENSNPNYSDTFFKRIQDLNISYLAQMEGLISSEIYNLEQEFEEL